MSVLWDALNNIDKITIALLILSLSIALFYEMINGFTFSQSVNWKVVYGILTALALSFVWVWSFIFAYEKLKKNYKASKIL